MTDRQRQPACMEWPLFPEPDGSEPGSSRRTMKVWQNGRCAMCGLGGRHWSSDLVLDHDHRTGLERGYLCRSCNSAEPHNDGPAFVRWRSGWNPATLLGHHEMYVNPFTGQVGPDESGMTPEMWATAVAVVSQLSYEDAP